MCRCMNAELGELREQISHSAIRGAGKENRQESEQGLRGPAS